MTSSAHYLAEFILILSVISTKLRLSFACSADRTCLTPCMQQTPYFFNSSRGLNCTRRIFSFDNIYRCQASSCATRSMTPLRLGYYARSQHSQEGFQRFKQSEPRILTRIITCYLQEGYFWGGSGDTTTIREDGKAPVCVTFSRMVAYLCIRFC